MRLARFIPKRSRPTRKRSTRSTARPCARTPLSNEADRVATRVRLHLCARFLAKGKAFKFPLRDAFIADRFCYRDPAWAHACWRCFGSIEGSPRMKSRRGRVGENVLFAWDIYIECSRLMEDAIVIASSTQDYDRTVNSVLPSCLQLLFVFSKRWY